MTDNNTVKYRVELDGQKLTDAQSRHLAENFVASLTPDKQARAKIVPITEGGQQVLFG
jgi:hypothetical protein